MFLRQNSIQLTKNHQQGELGVEKAKSGQKGMKSFHSFSRTVFEFPVSIQ